jgi:hypothetical protein
MTMIDVFPIQWPRNETMMIPSLELRNRIGIRVHVGIAHHHTFEIDEPIVISFQNFLRYCAGKKIHEKSEQVQMYCLLVLCLPINSSSNLRCGM